MKISTTSLLNTPRSSIFFPPELIYSKLCLGPLSKCIRKCWKQQCESTENLMHTAGSHWNSDILGGKQLKDLTVPLLEALNFKLNLFLIKFKIKFLNLILKIFQLNSKLNCSPHAERGIFSSQCVGDEKKRPKKNNQVLHIRNTQNSGKHNGIFNTFVCLLRYMD